MAPKPKQCSDLGRVCKKGNKWRVCVKIAGKEQCAPARDSLEETEEDLRAVRGAASRDDVPGIIAMLHESRQEQRLTSGLCSRGENMQPVTLRGLNIEHPFSQLILSGAKTIEARRYPLGHRNITHAGEEQFLIETPSKTANAAILGDAKINPSPRYAQVVGIVRFNTSTQYKGRASWRRDRLKHRITKDSKYDWAGAGEMHAWHVAEVRRFCKPVPAGLKTQTGYGTPRSLCIRFE